MSASSTAASISRSARWPGIALIGGAIVTIAAEAITASAWTVRPYSYANDYVNFLGAPFTGQFEGITISSPLWLLMSIGWILSGVLIAAAGIALSRQLAVKRRVVVVIVSVLQAIGLILFATIPLGPDTIASGLLGLYLAGAFLSVIAGNALIVAVGTAWRQLGLPRPTGIASAILGVIGLISIPATYGWAPIGIAERISVYSFLAGAAIIGISLLIRRTSSRS